MTGKRRGLVSRVHIADAWEGGHVSGRISWDSPTPGPGVTGGGLEQMPAARCGLFGKWSEFWKITQCAWQRTITSQSGGKTKTRFDCFTLLQLSIRIVLKTQKTEKTYADPWRNTY